VRQLQDYPIREDAKFLEDGFRDGFRLGYTGVLRSRKAPNLPSLAANIREARKLIQDEVAAGRVAGPFKQQPLPSLRCSPIGLVPKSSGKFRLIHHLSWPHGKSVNDGISAQAARVEYTSFDQVVDNIVLIGPGAMLAKADVKSAFRILPVNREDYQLLGFTLDGNFFYDMCVPFGCKSSCALWEKFAKFINWRIQQHCRAGEEAVHHYLDDFLVTAKRAYTCNRILNEFVKLCDGLGVPLAGEKMEGPSTVITFLGLTVDTLKMEVRVPADKIAKAKALVDGLIRRKKITLRELQSVIGSLNFLCRAVRPGRAFCSE